ncbi:MAG TPA: putative toxin-antitoxin system toxin component, PIN family [Coriobacteriia bacterium]
MAKSRILLDTNVLVSAYVSGGKPRRLLEAAEAGRFTLISSVHIVNELADVLCRPRFHPDEDDVATFVEELTELADIVAVEAADHGECRDADDQAVLLAAVLGKADVIVTGDHDLLELRDPPMPIVTVDAMLQRLG